MGVGVVEWLESWAGRCSWLRVLAYMRRYLVQRRRWLRELLLGWPGRWEDWASMTGGVEGP